MNLFPDGFYYFFFNFRKNERQFAASGLQYRGMCTVFFLGGGVCSFVIIFGFVKLLTASVV